MTVEKMEQTIINNVKAIREIVLKAKHQGNERPSVIAKHYSSTISKFLGTKSFVKKDEVTRIYKMSEQLLKKVQKAS